MFLQGECLWTSASGRTLVLKKTTLTKLCDAERAALRQIVLQKLLDFQLGCSISPPKGMNFNIKSTLFYSHSLGVARTSNLLKSIRGFKP